MSDRCSSRGPGIYELLLTRLFHEVSLALRKPGTLSPVDVAMSELAHIEEASLDLRTRQPFPWSPEKATPIAGPKWWMLCDGQVEERLTTLDVNPGMAVGFLGGENADCREPCVENKTAHDHKSHQPSNRKSYAKCSHGNGPPGKSDLSTKPNRRLSS